MRLLISGKLYARYANVASCAINERHYLGNGATKSDLRLMESLLMTVSDP